MGLNDVCALVRTTAAPILGNIAVSVCLIVTNKALMKSEGFDFTMTLTTLHFLFTAIAMRVVHALGFFEKKEVPWKVMGLFAISGVGSIAFNNLTLQFNSVGFYQLMKLCCVPATVAVDSFFFGKTFSRMVLFSLVILLVGISGATVTDLEFNWKGFWFGILAVVFTTWYQIWIGKIQTDHSLSQFQLLYAVTPFWTSMTFVIALGSDHVAKRASGEESVFDATLSTNTILLMVVSCAFAVGVNFSGFLLIHVTSALTYMVVGHAKTLLILTSAFLVFGSVLSAENALFILVAFIGVVMYGYYKAQKPTKPAAEPAAVPLTSLHANEDDPV